MDQAAYRVVVPEYLVRFARQRGPSGEQWLQRIPVLVAELMARWGVELAAPLGDPPGPAGWIAPGRLASGTEVMFKLSWPHREAETEADGLRFFDGQGAVRLLASDPAHLALVTERVRPGDDLWTLEVDEANQVAATVLGRLWRPPSAAARSIGTLAAEFTGWRRRFRTDRPEYPSQLLQMVADRGQQLVDTQPDLVVLHGDFNPNNVLRSSGGEWLAIDPKPLIGEPAYDLAQYLANRLEAAERLPSPRRELLRQIAMFAETLGLEASRIAGWAAVKAVGWDWGPARAAFFADLAEA